MTLMVPISPEVEAKLRQRAAAEGQETAAYASRLLEEAVSRLSLEQLLAPLRQQFAASGTTDQKLIQQISEAQAAYRQQP